MKYQLHHPLKKNRFKNIYELLQLKRLYQKLSRSTQSPIQVVIPHQEAELRQLQQVVRGYKEKVELLEGENKFLKSSLELIPSLLKN